MIVAKRISFDAAHRLPYYVGKCQNLHGHHWIVELAIEGPVIKEQGFVVDFGRLKEWLKENVVDIFDHSVLNDTVENPTAENLVFWIRKEFESTGWSISGDINLRWIKVWETEDSYAMWEAR